MCFSVHYGANGKAMSLASARGCVCLFENIRFWNIRSILILYELIGVLSYSIFFVCMSRELFQIPLDLHHYLRC